MRLLAGAVRRLREECGQASLELVGMLPWMLLSAMFVWQILIVAYTATSTENAARTGSRVASRGGEARKAALVALPGVLDDGAEVAVAGERTTVTVRVPILLPGVSVGAWTLSKSAELPGG
ncbi:MAG: TadE/TadG family type IV pilus assembly protein [Solirubrobacteraceae bacterium]